MDSRLQMPYAFDGPSVCRSVLSSDHMSVPPSVMREWKSKTAHFRQCFLGPQRYCKAGLLLSFLFHVQSGLLLFFFLFHVHSFFFLFAPLSPYDSTLIDELSFPALLKIDISHPPKSIRMTACVYDPSKVKLF